MQNLNYHTDLCPCGSGRIIKDCCLTKRSSTIPPCPKTGYSNPRCYARALNDCDQKLSREHYISNSVLALFDNEISLKGFPWLNSNELRDVSMTSLTSKVLCARHNSALSGLDSTAFTLFNYLTGNKIDKNQEVLLINGNEIERWMLKTLCGIVASGNVVMDSKKISDWQPPHQWLDVLFGDGRIPPNCGLYYIVGRWHRSTSQFIIMQHAASNTPDNIVAMSFAISDFLFHFCMEPPPPKFFKPKPSGAEPRYHPEGLQIRMTNDVREVHFGWPEGHFIITEIKDVQRN